MSEDMEMSESGTCVSTEPQVNGEAGMSFCTDENHLESPTKHPKEHDLECAQGTGLTKEGEQPQDDNANDKMKEQMQHTNGEDFKGFDSTIVDETLEETITTYTHLIDKIEEEVAAEGARLRPVREVSGRRASGAGGPSAVSSPLLLVPLQYGWRRELVHRAALDAYNRRNSDVYYYTPQGKKLRSTREIHEHLRSSGSPLTLENFSFFKEPLGVNDPDLEIIRDAKPIGRRAEGASTPPPHGSPRAHKPAAAAAAPTPPPTVPRLKVKSVGSRVSSAGAGGVKRAPAVDNNNTPLPAKRANSSGEEAAPPAPAPAPVVAPPPAPTPAVAPPAAPVRPSQQRVEPCSVRCVGAGGAVPTLPCALCLCLYHAPCAGVPPHHQPPSPFTCKNCVSAPTSLAGRRPPSAAGAGSTLAAPPAHPAPPRSKAGGGSGIGASALGVRALPQSVAVVARRAYIVVPTPPSHARALRSARRARANGAVGSPPAEQRRLAPDHDYFTEFYNMSQQKKYNVVVQIFGYLGMRDVCACARVCRLWREVAGSAALWRHVRMKNTAVGSWAGLAGALRRHGTRHLDLRKMLVPARVAASPALDAAYWDQFAASLPQLSALTQLELCRCPARALQDAAAALTRLEVLSAPAIRDGTLDPRPLASLTALRSLRLKSLAGLTLTSSLAPLASLKRLTHLSLTSIKELGTLGCEVIGKLTALESLELGECGGGSGGDGAAWWDALRALTRLQRLRLERATHECAAPHHLRALSRLPSLTQLELVNFDVKVGFAEALAACTNIERLLIIPTYVSQSATTNAQVLAGVLRLRATLTHLMWGVTIELLRVTELFIDQCEQAAPGSGSGSHAARRPPVGECIPVLKPVPGLGEPAPADVTAAAAPPNPPQVEILPLPALQKLLSTSLPTTKLKLLRIPFHATWRQSLADFH